MHPFTDRVKVTFVLVVLMAVTFAVYWPAHKYKYILFDDPDYVVENYTVQAGLSWQGTKWAFGAGHAGNWHPVTWLSHMLDCQLFGLDSGKHHLVSVLLHITNTLLLFGLLKRTTSAVWPSMFVAAAFALHPLHVESVAWISERKDVLSTFLWMLTLVCYTWYVRRGGKGLFIYLLTLGVFALGLMAKPMLISLPFVLLLLDYWPLGRIEFGNRSPGSFGSRLGLLVFEKIPFFVLATVLSIVTFFVQQAWGAVKPMHSFPLWVRVANAFVSYARYIEKMFLPSRLAVFYPHEGNQVSLLYAVASVIMLLVLSTAAVKIGRKNKYLVTGWFWYLGTLVPVIGLVQVGDQALADRYTYIPLTGLFIVIAWGLSDLTAKFEYRRVVLPVISTVILAILTMCTGRQLHRWQNSSTLFRHTLSVTTNNSKIHNNMGNVLQFQGRYDEAIAHYKHALQIDPNRATTYNNLGTVLLMQEEYDSAIDYFQKAIESNPHYLSPYNNLGLTLQSQGRVEQSVEYYLRALQLKPADAGANYNIANAYELLGRYQKAVVHYRKAVKARPVYAKAHNNLAIVLAKTGKKDEALHHFRQALRTEPNDAGLHYNIGLLLYDKKRFEESAEEFKIAMRIDPNYVEATELLGVLNGQK